MAKKNPNLALWNSVCVTDPDCTREVAYGQRKFTAIDAYSQIRVATAQWGSYGGTWKLKDICLHYDRVPKLCVLTAVFEYPDGSFPIVNAIEHTSGKDVLDSDHLKKLETDTITKALSRLGFNADVFLRKFDDYRYVEALKERKTASKAAKAKADAAPATPDERKALQDYLRENYDMFAPDLQAWANAAASHKDSTSQQIQDGLKKMRAVVRKMEKSPPEKLHGKIHALGTELYGDEWDAKRHAMVAEITNGLFESMTDMSPDELSTLCERLESMSKSTLEPTAQEEAEAGKVFH